MSERACKGKRAEHAKVWASRVAVGVQEAGGHAKLAQASRLANGFQGWTCSEAQGASSVR